MTDDNDRLDALEARLDRLEAENEQLQEEKDQLADRVDDLEEEKDQLQEENAQLKQRVADLEEQPTVSMEPGDLESIEIGNIPVGNIITAKQSKEDFKTELADLKADLEASNPTLEGGENTVQHHETHLEEVVSWPDEIATESLSPNQQRARHIASNLDDYSRQTPKGRVMDTSDLRTVMSARFDTTHSETINRVREFFDDLGGDEVEIKEPSMAGFSPDTAHDRRGKRVVISDDLARRLRQAAEEGHDVVTRAEA